MQNDTFNTLMAACESVPRLTDIEIRHINRKDLYGMPMQFGDPLVYLHFPVSIQQGIREIEFLDFAYLNCSEFYLQFRPNAINDILRSFPDARLLSETNLVKVSKEHEIVFASRNHLIVRRRP